MSKAYLSHLKNAADLKTTREQIRAGFVALALEKNRRATPFVTQARALQEAASHAEKAMGLLDLPQIQSALITAAGVSDKASNHLQDDDKKKAVLGLIENFLEPAGSKFVEELVFRFLLIRGGTLDGSMRNAGGFIAQCSLTRSLVAALRLAGKPYRWLYSDGNVWADMPEDDAGIEFKLRGLSWRNADQARTLFYNVKVPVVRNNIDMVLLNVKIEGARQQTMEDPNAYLALGELKGGIDPAGADEHWKTAQAALDRIRGAFAKKQFKPHTFFIGAAIETRMADEIWTMLEDGLLENAANLTEVNQLAAIVSWICSL
jgi:hypothetical protein